MVDDARNPLPEDGPDELEDLFAFYVDRLNRGHRVHPLEILVKHPDVGEPLLGYLEDYAATGAPADSVRSLGDYDLEEEIGRGGMGVVYRAWQSSLDREVALKILPVGIAADDRAFHRFMREAKTAARLNHENIVRVYGMGVEASTPYYAMELVDGQTLAQLLAGEDETVAVASAFGGTDRGIVDHKRIAGAFAEVSDGLQHAHTRGIVHRDIKPSNLILDGQGRLRILDFGLARSEGHETLTLSGDVVGTPAYMSPEQARRRTKIDHRTDIYSLGTTLYEVLALRPPFKGRDHSDTLSQILQRDPLPLRRFDAAIPRSLETIVLKCLRKDPRDRYQTAEDLREDLRRFAKGEPIEARPLPPWQRGLRWAERNTVRIGAAVMILATLSFLTLSVLQPQGMVQQRVLTDISRNMRPSPDGRRLAYTRMDFEGELMVRDLETGVTTQLTEESLGGVPPVWSPDGKKIAYGQYEASSGLTSLRILDLETGVSVTPEGAEGLRLIPLDWSPDGQTLLCWGSAESIDSLVAVRLDSGIVQTLVEQGLQWESTAVFSRDGQHIAYSADVNDNVDVFIVAADGSDKRRITDAPGADIDPMWSPDGNTLIYYGDGMWSVKVADGQPVESPVFLRSGYLGQPLVWTQEAGLFYRGEDHSSTFYSIGVDVQAGALVGSPEPLAVPSGQYGGVFNWSPDMQRVVLYEGGALHVHSLVDGSDRSIPIELAHYQNFWWSPDGAGIFYVPRGQEDRGVYRIDPSSGETRRLFSPTAHGERFHLSPDERSVLFYRWNGELRNDGQRELVVTDLDGSDVRVLASEREEEVVWLSNFARPFFSPDGQQVLFSTGGMDQPAKLWVAAADGSSRKVVATAAAPEQFIQTAHWHPGGRYIAWVVMQSLFLTDLETGDTHELPLPKDVIGDLGGIWQWSPDGTRIALTGNRGAGAELWTVKNLLSK